MFRRQQEEVDKALLSQSGDTPDPSAPGKVGNTAAAEPEWAINARKRKRAKEKDGLRGIKLRKSSTSETPSATATPDKAAGDPTRTSTPEERKAESSFPVGKDVVSVNPPYMPKSTNPPGALVDKVAPKKAALSNLGLAGYSSDED